ncbi:MAG: response regulator [Patescibacteria group bacterium]|jgi:response regulator of citrate/malate metabolism
MKNKVLIIEDDLITQELFKRQLSPYSDIIQASTLEEAENKYDDEKNITMILVDGQLGPQPDLDEGPNTVRLTTKIRKTFKGLMIAISINEESNKILKMIGCDYAVYKGDAVPLAIKLLSTS